ncbi:MAG TPA: class I SAM-dependent methyltransferase [Saprospiraceae bacterium]|nr:class I SAM-dependent methyltransferase [Saprospiraceae bacterium]
MTPKKINSLFTHLKLIQGWFDQEAALLLSLVDSFQKKNNVSGNIFEIGVHHGKSAIFLSHLLNEDEHIDVCDIFDQQQNNVSNSGFGSQTIFLNNMESLGKKMPRSIHKNLSSELAESVMLPPYRIFHIDGGHLCEEAYSDLILACKFLHDKGVIVLDDPFRIEWPGVTEALVRFLNENQNYTGFLGGFNKLYICKTDVGDDYLSWVNDLQNIRNFNLDYPVQNKQHDFFNKPIKIFYYNLNQNPNSLKEEIWRRLKRYKK